MSGAFETILGKTISGVYVRENKSNPSGQAFLVFDDGTYFEFYSTDPIKGTKGIDKGDLDRVIEISIQREGKEIFCDQLTNERGV